LAFLHKKKIMWSNLQKMIGIQAGIIPTTLQPNEYMDNLLENAQITMKERGLDNIDLPEQTQGITLYDGRMTGLENLSRSGDVVIEAENDHFLLSFALEVNNIRVNYWWKEMKLKGTVTAVIQQVRIEMKIKLMTDRNNSAPPELLVFNVEKIEGIKVTVRGLGPLNWVIKKILKELLKRKLKGFLEEEGRDIVQQEMQTAIEKSGTETLITMLGPQLVRN